MCQLNMQFDFTLLASHRINKIYTMTSKMIAELFTALNVFLCIFHGNLQWS